MKTVFYSIFILSFFCAPITYASSLLQEGDSWSSLANEIMDNVKKNDFMVAKGNLKELSDKFSSSNLADKSLTVAAIRALSDTILDLEYSLGRITPRKGELVENATKLSLAFDAVTHPNQPMWKKYHTSLKRDLGEIEGSLGEKDQKKVNKLISHVQSTFKQLEPALMISKSPQAVEKVNSLLSFIDNQKDTKQKLGAIKELKSLLGPIFLGSEREVSAFIGPFKSNDPVNSLCLILLGVILGVLGFMSWQKFNYFNKDNR